MSVSIKIKKKLDNFSLDVELSLENGLLVIEGPSGAGKTTILNCIAGIITPDAGIISTGDRILFSKGTAARSYRTSFSSFINIPPEKRNIGYLFQRYALFPHMTVRENIIYGLKNKKEYRKRTGRKKLIDHAEHTMEMLRIDHLSNKRASSISGGEMQRTALARVMVTEPALLLLDEPFSALDEGTKELIYEEFSRFKEILNIPTILITHDHEETKRFADKTVFLQQGRITEKPQTVHRIIDNNISQRKAD